MCQLGAGTVIWINGCFGVGKTTVATRLVESWSGTVLFDPELVGTILRMTLPRDRQLADYQDLPLWRELTVATVRALARATDEPVVIPMTLVVPQYFEEIVGGLAEAGVKVRHITLTASRGTIERRLRERSDTTEWTYGQIDRCLAALEGSRFSASIDTERRSIEEVVADIRHAFAAD